MILFQLLHVVQHHHASSVGPIQLHCHCNLEEKLLENYLNLIIFIILNTLKTADHHLFSLFNQGVTDGCSHSIGVAGIEPISFCGLLLIVSWLSFLQKQHSITNLNMLWQEIICHWKDCRLPKQFTNNICECGICFVQVIFALIKFYTSSTEHCTST